MPFRSIGPIKLDVGRLRYLGQSRRVSSFDEVRSSVSIELVEGCGMQKDAKYCMGGGGKSSRSSVDDGHAFVFRRTDAPYN